MIYIVIFIVLNYLILILCFSWGFDNVDTFKKSKSTSFNKFSIVTALRNEENNLPKLLTSLNQLEYNPANFEVILVDDQSTDNSKKLIEEFIQKHSHLNCKYLYNETIAKSPKKEALKKGIENAKFEWVLTTDADCIVPKTWLSSFNNFLQKKKSVLIVAPVRYAQQNNFLSKFQGIDFLSLIGATIGSFGLKKPIMANGANLCFSKIAFKKINGYEGNDHIASGDDIFLLEKMVSNYKNEVHYLKSTQAIVTTQAQKTIYGLIQQRVRWASKATKYQNQFTKYTGIIVLLMNFTVCLLLVLALAEFLNFKYFSIVFLAKFIVDNLLIIKTATFFKNPLSFFNLLLSSLIYPFFNVSIALISFRKKYTWKERTFVNQG